MRDPFYETELWRQLSRLCKRRANYTCQSPGCGFQPSARERYKLHAHHVIPRPIGPDRIENLICLCETCHSRQHKHKIWTSKSSGTTKGPQPFRAKRYRPGPKLR